jgi:hypothetical protein
MDAFANAKHAWLFVEISKPALCEKTHMQQLLLGEAFEH